MSHTKYFYVALEYTTVWHVTLYSLELQYLLCKIKFHESILPRACYLVDEPPCGFRRDGRTVNSRASLTPIGSRPRRVGRRQICRLLQSLRAHGADGLIGNGAGRATSSGGGGSRDRAGHLAQSATRFWPDLGGRKAFRASVAAMSRRRDPDREAVWVRGEGQVENGPGESDPLLASIGPSGVPIVTEGLMNRSLQYRIYILTNYPFSHKLKFSPEHIRCLTSGRRFR
jgi:hypothetical protein